MEKTVDFRKSVYTLSQENPEILEIMALAGFASVTAPGNIKTVGRVMTIPKGARMKGLDLEEVREAFRCRGYEIIE